VLLLHVNLYSLVSILSFSSNSPRTRYNLVQRNYARTIYLHSDRRAYQPQTRVLSAAPTLLSYPSGIEDGGVASTTQGDITVVPDASETLSATPVDVTMNTPGEDLEYQPGKRPRRNKGKGKEQASVIKIKDEPVPISLSLFDNPRMVRRPYFFTPINILRSSSHRPTKITVPPVVPLHLEEDSYIVTAVLARFILCA
jgi:hypothetical protein